MPINKHPSVIGYWARVHNLTWDKLFPDADEVSKALTEYDETAYAAAVARAGGSATVTYTGSRELFEEGWSQAESEIEEENIRELFNSLEEAYLPEGKDEVPRRKRKATKSVHDTSVGSEGASSSLLAEPGSV